MQKIAKVIVTCLYALALFQLFFLLYAQLTSAPTMDIVDIKTGAILVIVIILLIEKGESNEE